MISLIVYLVEVSAVLAILYALYWLLLRRETFFSFNRFYLLAILLLSMLIPLLDIDVLPIERKEVQQPIVDLTELRATIYNSFTDWANPSESKRLLNDSLKSNEVLEKSRSQPLLVSILLMVYFLGLLTVIVRLLVVLIRIHRFKKSGHLQVIQKLNVVRVPELIGPFSFLSIVFIPKEMKEGADLNQVLAHERIHIREGHSYDLLFVQLIAAGLWFNPLVWQLLKSLKKTHEYIADKKTIDQGYSLVAYQSLLLRQLISTNSFGLIHHFNLTFIKQRIAMMNIQKSGWKGKVKVALSVFCAVVFSLTLMQCNTGIDEQVLQESQSSAAIEANDGVDVPLIPASHFKLRDHSTTVNLTVDNNTVTVNGEVVELEGLTSLIEDISEEKYAMILRIDRNQSMSLVREVQRELRRANRLKVLYIGQTAEGQMSEVPIKLPPLPGSNSKFYVPKIDDAYAKENNLSLLKIRMSENTGPEQQQQVYNFAKEHVAQQNTNYVVSARFSDSDTYGQYLESIYYLQKAFYQLYEEQAQSKYGESYIDILDKADTSDKYAEIYSNLKKEAPMAISIAEDYLE
ncbi:MAG: M56 family metallopeptidase [Bacteroidota bacterium]